MKLITALAFVSVCASITGCASKATTPLPTQELNAYGSDSTQGGSLEVATSEATKFCKRWNAAPAILNKQVKYKGKLKEDTQNAVNIATETANALGAFIPSIGGDAYETTITYKCL